MNNNIIKFMIENKKPRAYSLIVQLYFDKIELYKTSVFKMWLAKELNLSPDLIHDSSITAAMGRYRKKKLANSKLMPMKEERQQVKETENFNTETPVFPGFK